MQTAPICMYLSAILRLIWWCIMLVDRVSIKGVQCAPNASCCKFHGELMTWASYGRVLTVGEPLRGAGSARLLWHLRITDICRWRERLDTRVMHYAFPCCHLWIALLSRASLLWMHIMTWCPRGKNYKIVPLIENVEIVKSVLFQCLRNVFCILSISKMVYHNTTPRWPDKFIRWG